MKGAERIREVWLGERQMHICVDQMWRKNLWQWNGLKRKEEKEVCLNCYERESPFARVYGKGNREILFVYS
jgi:hypothetical protein